jgi:hypothetical protein
VAHSQPATSEPAARQIAGILGLDADEWSAASTNIGNGQVAQCRRWEYTRGSDSVCVVAKTPSADDVSRKTAQAQHLYRRETAFYRELQPEVTVTTPDVLHVAYDETTDDFLILLSDLTPSTPIDQFQGFTVDQVALGLDELVGLHGPTVNRRDLFERPWLGGVSKSLGPLYEAVLPTLFKQFLETYGGQVTDAASVLVERLAQQLGVFAGYTPPLRCVAHGDFRIENLILDGRAGEVPLAVLDWQTVMVSSPFLDVAYFVTTSLSPEDRVASEVELINSYRERLAKYGYAISEDTARQEYARYTLQPILMLVAASVIVERTERGDAMFLTMIERGVQAATDWDALAVVS